MNVFPPPTQYPSYTLPYTPVSTSTPVSNPSPPAANQVGTQPPSVPSPYANFSYKIYADGRVDFTNLSSNATSYEWDFGDGSKSSIVNPVHYYSSAGNKTVILKATNSAGTVTKQIVIALTILPKQADFTYVKSGLKVFFTDASTIIGTSFLWNFGDGSTSTEQNPVKTYAVAGDYNVVLTVNGTYVKSQTVSVSANPIRIIASFITGGPQFKIYDGGGNLLFTYNGLLDVNCGDCRFVSAVFSEENNQYYGLEYNVYNRVQILDSAGNYLSNFGSNYLQINSLHNIVVANSKVYVTSSVKNAYPAGIRIFDLAGNYLSSISISNAFGLFVTSSRIYVAVGNAINVYDLNGNSLFNIPCSSTTNAVIEEDSKIYALNFTANTVIAYDLNGNYLFNFSNLPSSVFGIGASLEFIYIHTQYGVLRKYDFNGNYLSTLIANTNAFGNVSARGGTLTSNLPVASFTTNVSSGVAPLTVNFTDTSTGTPTAWTWQWGDGTANGTTQNPSHEFGVGVWTVKLIAANAYGVSSYIKTITVIARDTYTAPDPIPSPSAEPQSSIIQTGAATSYILDKVNNKVLMYDSAKTYLGYFGGIGSGDGQFNTPVWLTKEGNNILVADSGNNRIQVFDANGTFISKFGTANFKGVASNGVYRYATDYDNNKVIVFNMLGVKVTEFGSTGSGRGEFKQPYGIAVDNNYIYVVDKQRLQAFTLGYEFVAEAGRAEVNNPTDLWFDAINLYINNSGNNEVLTYSRAFNFPTSVNISKTLTLTNTIMGAS